MMTPLHMRPDGSRVVRLSNGWPYHVTPADPLWGEAQALDWSQAVPEPEPKTPLNVQAIVQAHINGVARSMNYDSGVSCAGYLGSTVPQWAEEARAFVAWRDAVWLAVFARIGDAPPATADGVIALLPDFVRPGAPA